MKLQPKYFVLFSVLILLLISQLRCNNPSDPYEQETKPITEANGPGGPAYLYGYLKDYIHPAKPASNTHIYIMNHQNYSDTLLHVFVNSTDGSFKITELPVGRYDVIFMNENYLCAKLGKLNLTAIGNSFYNPSSSGYFIDSTVYITNIADSVGRQDAPEFGLQGYDAGIIVYFKSETNDSLAWDIIQSSGCDTVRVDRYDDPVFDLFENDVYLLKCPSIKSISVKLKFFNWFKEVNRAGQIFQVVQK